MNRKTGVLALAGVVLLCGVVAFTSRAPVQAVGLVRLEVEDAVRAREFVRLRDGVVQGLAELRRARLGLAGPGGARGGIGEHRRRYRKLP